MKRKGYIVDRLTLDDIRREAHVIASSNRVRRRQANLFLKQFDERAPKLLASIQKGEWRPGKLRVRDIVEHGKLRHIEVPHFEDTLVQRVLCYPRLESIFVNHTWPHSFSSIKGRGPLKAAKHVARLIRKRSARWCLYFDVKKYYAHIDRTTMKQDIRDCVKDPIAISLISRIVDMGEKGIAIGNTISHFLANLYLTPVIEAIAHERGVTDVVVYMDNVFVFGSSKRAMHNVRLGATETLRRRNLEMKNDWQVFRVDKRAVKIGGYRIQKGKPWRIYHATFRHLSRTISKINKRLTLRFARRLASLKGWIENAGCRHFYKTHIHTLWPKARKVIQTCSSEPITQ